MGDNSLFTENQSGFQPGDSCTNQQHSLVHKIHEYFDGGLEVRSIYLDMSKAFDNVWHDDLIFKLEQKVLRASCLIFCQYYLSNTALMKFIIFAQ